MNGFFNTVRAEVFKLRHKRRSYVMAGFLWLLLPALLLLVGWILQTRVAGTFADEGFDVAEVVQAVASPLAIARNSLLSLGILSPSLLIIIVALTAALLIGEERSQNMWKTLLTAQPNRVAVLSGKITVGDAVFRCAAARQPRRQRGIRFAGYALFADFVWDGLG